MKELVFKHQIGKMSLLYVSQEGCVSMLLIPAEMEQYIDYSDQAAFDGLIQIYLTGDTNFISYSSGQTMRNSSTANSFRLKGQSVRNRNGATTIETVFTADRGLTVTNYVEYEEGSCSVRTFNTLANNGEDSVTVEMIASFSISSISPFTDDPDMRIHRMLGNWSAEGRPECRKIESAGLERSWADYGLRLEKFGSIGSMPIQRYFPFLCLEDCDSSTLWGIMLEAPYSWQIETSRYNRYFSVSGGIADFEFGQFRKILRKGEELTTTAAYLTVGREGIDEIYNSLRRAINKAGYSRKEKELPILYNEYCDSWGHPTHEKILQTARIAKKCGAEYFVIDAGWYCDSREKWSRTVGDYIPEKDSFPFTIAETAKEIRKLGLIPGIWFEVECVAEETKTFRDESLFLKRDGHRILSGNRAFLDIRKDNVRKHLKRKVTDFLKKNGFGYIKVDYNECFGIGCDGDDSFGAGLKSQIEAVQDFFREMRAEIPDLVIESCASGGHRLEPSFLSLTDMTSFSDAHEVYEGAVIAANVNKLCPTRKNQIWAVVNDSYSAAEVRYSLAKTLFGRFCLSGDIANIAPEKMNLIRSFADFYRKVTYILKDDNNYYYGNTDLKYRDLKGEQAVLKVAADGSGALLIAHGFGNAKPITVKKPGLSEYVIEDVFASPQIRIARNRDEITVHPGEFDACALYLKRSLFH